MLFIVMVSFSHLSAHSQTSSTAQYAQKADYHWYKNINPICPVGGGTATPATMTTVPIWIIIIHFLPNGWCQSVGNLWYHTNVE